MALLSLALLALALAPLERVAAMLPRREILASPWRIDPRHATGALLACVLAVGLGGLPLHTTLLALALLVGLALGVQESRAAARRRRLQTTLPAVTESLAAAIRAGLPLADAMVAIAPGHPEPIAAALREAAALLRLGRPLDEALARSDALFGPPALLVRETLRAFHRRGGNVARALERTAALARAESQLQDEIHALTAQGRASALVLALLAPLGLLFFLVANPGGARAFVADPRGQLLLSAALLLEGIGALWLWRLVRR